VSSDDRPDDRAAIAAAVRTFFAAFTSGPDVTARLDALRRLFLPEAVIVRTCGGPPVVHGVDDFIAPRQELLAGGTLTDFREWEVAGRTEVFGDIAHHFCSYAKAGVQDGNPFTGRGMKTLQFVRTPAGWRISAAAWDDEREGLVMDTDS
jgi:SnoaL-like domain